MASKPPRLYVGDGASVGTVQPSPERIFQERVFGRLHGSTVAAGPARSRRARGHCVARVVSVRCRAQLHQRIRSILPSHADGVASGSLGGIERRIGALQEGGERLAWMAFH